MNNAAKYLLIWSVGRALKHGRYQPVINVLTLSGRPCATFFHQRDAVAWCEHNKETDR